MVVAHRAWQLVEACRQHSPGRRRCACVRYTWAQPRAACCTCGMVPRRRETGHGLRRCRDPSTCRFAVRTCSSTVTAIPTTGLTVATAPLSTSGASTVATRKYGSCDRPDVVIARAESMLGTSGYHLFANNCEHFATWCMTGERDSAQVQTAYRIASAVVAHQRAPRLAKGIVAGLRKTAPASAANIMSGLKVLGGSPARGIGTVAAVGAIAGARTMYLALGDKPYLTEQELAARRAGRAAGIGGAVAAGGVVYCGCEARRAWLRRGGDLVGPGCAGRRRRRHARRGRGDGRSSRCGRDCARAARVPWNALAFRDGPRAAVISLGSSTSQAGRRAGRAQQDFVAPAVW
jgi:Lecithin retinol acyltransferase